MIFVTNMHAGSNYSTHLFLNAFSLLAIYPCMRIFQKFTKFYQGTSPRVSEGARVSPRPREIHWSSHDEHEPIMCIPELFFVI